MSFNAFFMSFHVMGRYVKSWYVMSYYVLRCHGMSCYVMFIAVMRFMGDHPLKGLTEQEVVNTFLKVTPTPSTVGGFVLC
jgi:hypothetical protein